MTEHNIPFDNSGLYVHCPIEVRVSDTTTDRLHCKVHPFLDPTSHDGPTLYLNATLYRPYGKDPPCRDRYYQAFEWLMRELGGRPHWAKNFLYTDRNQISAMYGGEMDKFLAVRNESDPDGMFLGHWHMQNLPVDSVVEEEVNKRPMGFGWGDAVLWEGMVKDFPTLESEHGGVRFLDGHANEEDTPTTRSMTSRTSEESFDMMAKGEASVYHG